ncbi:MAG TPA: hypothetical protein DHN29_11255 [Cytophagales bacterium]|nr:hypothetical protein [Cytophagales bacterium]|tara:strand:+ start:1529 stop:1762 length:234 start_codon:yes stop_codon:yes gene_type:complete
MFKRGDIVKIKGDYEVKAGDDWLAKVDLGGGTYEVHSYIDSGWGYGLRLIGLRGIPLNTKAFELAPTLTNIIKQGKL